MRMDFKANILSHVYRWKRARHHTARNIVNLHTRHNQLALQFIANAYQMPDYAI